MLCASVLHTPALLQACGAAQMALLLLLLVLLWLVAARVLWMVMLAGC
jgi:hypothetical protein